MSASDHINPNFTEVAIPGSRPIRLMSPEHIAGLEGKRAIVHGHTPARQHLGHPVYSVSIGGKVVGHATDIHLRDAKPYIHQRLLREAQERGKKTANTLIIGSISPTPTEMPDRPLKIRPGVIVDAETNEDLREGLGQVRLGPEGAFYRRGGQ